MKLKCTEMLDYELKDQFPVLIIRNDSWHETSMELIEKMKNVISNEKVNLIFQRELGIKKLEVPPLNWKKMWTMGEFHNPLNFL